MENTRTTKLMKNARVALIFNLLFLLVSFLVRKVLIENLGAEVLGLNTTATNLLGFLNIAELGISAAISATLYKPLFDNDQETINDIITVQGWLYRRIATIVAVGGVILMMFFPLIFKKTELPLWYAYGSFGVLFFGALIGYIINYKQILLTAGQKDYKVTYIVAGAKIIKTVVQIIGIGMLSFDYKFWIITEFISAICVCLFLDRSVRRTYPWLSIDLSRGKELSLRYSHVITKTKQVFFHKIGGFVLYQTSPLVIYTFLSLTAVAIYGNYLLIASGLSLIINSIFNGITAGVGNLVAEGNRTKTYNFFREYTTIRFFLAAIICYCLYILVNPFINIWIGEGYLIDNISLILFISVQFLQLTRSSDTFIAAYGLYDDVWAPLVEAVLNLGLSCLFGSIWGLPGIIGGVTLSLLLVVFCWKPYFLHKYGFKTSVLGYILMTLKTLGLIAIASAASRYILGLRGDIRYGNFLQWGVDSAITLALFSSILTILFLLFSKDFREFALRTKKIILKK